VFDPAVPMSRVIRDGVRIDPLADPGAGRHYAGIGSRETPPAALALIEAASARLARHGWVLRTGMSPGADQAFYKGARSAGGGVELFLPWPGFEAGARLDGEGAEVCELSRPSARAYELAERHHPGWGRLGAAARHLLARDGHQVLGADLATAVGFVVCWTADGSLDGAGRGAGGTGQALRIARAERVPVFNLARPEHARTLFRPS
jgi:hypothetical protein